MKLIADCVSIILSLSVLAFLFSGKAISENHSLEIEKTLPPKVRTTLYIDRTFTDEERLTIIESAQAWKNATKGIVDYQIIILPDSQPIKFDDSLFIVKISPDNPEALTLKNKENILGFYLCKEDISTIFIINKEMEKLKFKSLVMHEMGHALGLAHQSSDEDIHTLMYPYMYITIAGLNISVSSDKITKTDLMQFCLLYQCEANQLTE